MLKRTLKTKRGKLTANKTDRNMGVTPLVALALSEADEQKSLEMCRLLLESGADPEQDDGGLGSWPLMQCADMGKVLMAQHLVSLGVDLLQTNKATVKDPENFNGRSTTTSLWMACQNNHLGIVSSILDGAATQGVLTELVDKTNLRGLTPCCVALQRGLCEIAGALIRAGSDLSRASPEFYQIPIGRDFDGTERMSNRTPTEDHPVHHALDRAVQSAAHKSCLGCGASPEREKTLTSKKKKKLSRCSCCKVAYFCGRDCQKKIWSKHKIVCKRLAHGSASLNVVGSTSLSSSSMSKKESSGERKEKEKEKELVLLLVVVGGGRGGRRV